MDKTIHCTSAVTTWGIMGTDGLLYATHALRIAAGIEAWPNLPPGMQLASLVLACEDGSGGNGSAFYFAINKGDEFSGLASDAVRDNNATRVAGGGQAYTVQGFVAGQSQMQIRNVWFRKTVANDETVSNGEF